jgi:hypothetical protein
MADSNTEHIEAFLGSDDMQADKSVRKYLTQRVCFQTPGVVL